MEWKLKEDELPKDEIRIIDDYYIILSTIKDSTKKSVQLGYWDGVDFLFLNDELELEIIPLYRIIAWFKIDFTYEGGSLYEVE